MKCLLTLITFCLSINSCLGGDYPKSKMEQEMDEMGSLLDGEGLVFRPGRTKSTTTKAKIGNVNKYLYQAAIDVLDFVPLASADSNSGVIVTEWYNPKGQRKTQFKINVYIKGDVISSEAIDVKAYERNKVNGKWEADYKESTIGGILEDKILRKARTMYQAER
jgi:hypothetical protein